MARKTLPSPIGLIPITYKPTSNLKQLGKLISDARRIKSTDLRTFIQQIKEKSKRARSQERQRLLKRQLRVLHDLVAILEQMENPETQKRVASLWSIDNGSDAEKAKGAENDLIKFYKPWNRLMARAIRNKLDDIPFIQKWVHQQRVLGEPLWLRRARKGQERGIRAPYTPLEVKVIEMALKGKSRAEIYRTLIADRTLSARMSVQAFYTRFTPLWKLFYTTRPPSHY